ncbi:MAG: tRNA uridine-5-carboxymethylaminomethyl(34) synthesis enzyme MnmG [Carboxydocellales bacterium]
MKEYLAGKYEVIVVGAGHAGCEAALAAARMGCRTLVLTLSLDNVALMPCNPAVGGPAKGHLVKEIDALGGEMGLNTDKTAVQMKMLNTGKGPAVHSLRAQSDKKWYQQEMINTLENQLNLDVKQALVERLVIKGQRVSGVVTNTGAMFLAAAVVITTGTYLKGRIIIGDISYQGGPNGQFAAVGLSGNLLELGVELARFKTGTPPRVDRRTVDFSKMIIQPGDEEIRNFSFISPVVPRKQLPCWLTYTSERTHQVIRDNLHRSPLYSGDIEGTGPRYCPSIEDKVVRFADRLSHQIFIEPEGWTTEEMYVQGFSTSLPEEVQIEMLRTIPGLEQVEMMRAGYAIEYDCVVPTQLKLSLEFKDIGGLFSAGQINGSSGYEEAAAQGLMAGINAALLVKSKGPLILTRSDAYIGVLIDDLVTKGTNEPYRMLTSRAEYRLLLRQDNADLRLTEMGADIGLVGAERYAIFRKRLNAIKVEKERLQKTIVPPSSVVLRVLDKLGSSPIRSGISLGDLLKRPEINFPDLQKFISGGTEINVDSSVGEQVEIQIKYAGYIEKQMEQVERFNKLEHRKLSGELNYQDIKGLSAEAIQKLNKLKPYSIGQASRISGVSPADISVILVYLEQRRRVGKKQADNYEQ